MKNQVGFLNQLSIKYTLTGSLKYSNTNCNCKFQKSSLISSLTLRAPTSTFLKNQDDSTMDLTELAVAMGSLLFPDQ